MKLRSSRPFLDQVVQLLNVEGRPARGMDLARAIEPGADTARLYAVANEIRRLAATSEGRRLFVRVSRGVYASRSVVAAQRAATRAIGVERPAAAVAAAIEPSASGREGYLAGTAAQPSPLNVALVTTTLDSVLKQLRAGAPMAPLADQVAIAAALMRASA